METIRQLYGSRIAAVNSTAQAPDFCAEYGHPFGYIAGGSWIYLCVDVDRT